MRYTSWDRSDREKPVLLEEDGPRQLGVFGEDVAEVDGEQWALSVDKQLGASMTLPDGREFSAHGRFNRDTNITATLDGHTFTFIGETSKEWIIEDASGDKVGQFTSAKRGVVKSIVEFDGDVEITEDEAIGLSWFARQILEERQGQSGVGLIALLVLLSIVAILAFVL